MIIRTLAVVAALIVLTTSASKAEIFLQGQAAEQDVSQDVQGTANTSDADGDRLLIVNGNNGHVLYDDGRDDLLCVTRSVVVGYNHWGYAIRKRVMRCR